MNSTLDRLQPTPVFESYWRFAAERQAIFFRRVHGNKSPWTNDEILRQYRFTNTYRASDRVSQYLIRNVIYNGESSPQEVFFRTILFKLFNKIETWETLCGEFGRPTYADFRPNHVSKVLTNQLNKGVKIYSAAYIMPSGKRSNGSHRKHDSHLLLLDMMIKDDVPRRITEASSMKDVYELLLSYPMIGPFLAYQYTIDLNYSELTNFSEMEFVVPGPGALDGLRKCFGNISNVNADYVIRLVTENQDSEFERLGLRFESLWGRPLQLVDCQNLFCEIGKYARVKHPDVKGVSQRSRIKQRYHGSSGPLENWYPPKWGINDLIKEHTPITCQSSP